MKNILIKLVLKKLSKTMNVTVTAGNMPQLYAMSNKQLIEYLMP